MNWRLKTEVFLHGLCFYRLAITILYTAVYRIVSDFMKNVA